MPTYYLPYGKSSINFRLSNEYLTFQILPQSQKPSADPLKTVYKAFKTPCGDFDEGIFKQGLTVGIAINDPTRPIPHSILLTPLLDYLESFGIQKNQIHLFIATGTHKPISKNEFTSFLPLDIVQMYQITCHDCDDNLSLTNIGTTKRGTPVLINSQFFQKNIKIVVGDIEPHHFQGFSGGVKSAAIGLAGRKTIDINHRLMMDIHSFIGEYDLNPTRQDVEEIGDLIEIDAALNAVLNLDKQIVEVFWGKPREVMIAGIPFVKRICQSIETEPFDLVIASPGGYPKDINLYQSQKALTHAGLFVKENGIIILCAECIQGVGSSQYLEFMEELESFSEVINKFNKTDFKVGPHKAFQIARQGLRNKIFLVSSIDAATIKKLLLIPFNNVASALQSVLPLLSSHARIGILPYATNTIILPDKNQ